MDLAACKALEIRGSALRPLRRIPGWGPGSLVPLPAPLKHTAPAWRALQRSLSRATSCASKRGNRPRIRAGPSRFRTAPSLFRRHVATRTATSERAALRHAAPGKKDDATPLHAPRGPHEVPHLARPAAAARAARADAKGRRRDVDGARQRAYCRNHRVESGKRS